MKTLEIDMFKGYDKIKQKRKDVKIKVKLWKIMSLKFSQKNAIQIGSETHSVKTHWMALTLHKIQKR